MWLEMKKEVELELAMLHELLDAARVQRAECLVSAPDFMGTMAWAAFLHSFYSGIENIFQRIAIHADGGKQRGAKWHQDLLDSMARPGASRPAVVSTELVEVIQGYLDWRHRFRNLYAHKLDWERMADLVRDSGNTLNRLEGELNTFLKATEPQATGSAAPGSGGEPKQ